MDQDTARYIGLGITYESMAMAIGQFRALAVLQSNQLTAQAKEIEALKAQVASLEVNAKPAAA